MAISILAIAAAGCLAVPLLDWREKARREGRPESAKWAAIALAFLAGSTYAVIRYLIFASR